MLCGGQRRKVDLLPQDSADTGENRRIDGQRRRISLRVRGAGYELLIPFRGYSAELKRERNQRSLSIRLATAKTSDAKRFSLTDNPLRGAFGIAPLCTLLAFGLDFVLGTILNCLFDLTTRPTTHYLENGISMRWQMGIQGGHCDFIELFTWWRNPWPKDFVDYKYEKGGIGGSLEE